jgi:hypothetical protein
MSWFHCLCSTPNLVLNLQKLQSFHSRMIDHGRTETPRRNQICWLRDCQLLVTFWFQWPWNAKKEPYSAYNLSHEPVPGPVRSCRARLALFTTVLDLLTSSWNDLWSRSESAESVPWQMPLTWIAAPSHRDLSKSLSLHWLFSVRVCSRLCWSPIWY